MDYAGTVIRSLDGKLIAMHCDIDLVTEIETVSLFTDDGYGNGDCIAMCALTDLIEIVRKYENATGVRIF